MARARSDTLWTPLRKAMIFKEEGPSTGSTCETKRFCHLLHFLNNCTYNMKEMTVRYNMIQEVLLNDVRKHSRLVADEIWTNNEINIGKFTKEIREPSFGEEAKQRQNIQFSVNTSEENDVIEIWKLIIVEITVPFRKVDKGNEYENPLKG
jgi:hypothetical protein